MLMYKLIIPLSKLCYLQGALFVSISRVYNHALFQYLFQYLGII